MNLFTQAYRGLNLSPAARATLKFVQHLLYSAALTGVTAALPYLSGAAPNWRAVLTVGLATFGMTALATFGKWASAQGDAPLAAGAAALEQDISNKTGIPEPVVPIDASVFRDGPQTVPIPAVMGRPPAAPTQAA